MAACGCQLDELAAQGKENIGKAYSLKLHCSYSYGMIPCYNYISSMAMELSRIFFHTIIVLEF
jgi:hypothetical protein